MLASLTPREERVLRMRFGIGMNTDHTLEEVGQQFSVTRERIRQIEAKALRKLKHPSRVAQAAGASSTADLPAGAAAGRRRPGDAGAALGPTGFANPGRAVTSSLQRKIIVPTDGPRPL